MRGSDLALLVEEEVAKARLRLRYELRRGPTGCYLLLWSDLAWMEGIGNRKFLGHDDIRRREANIGILTLHSRVPSIVYGGTIAGVDPLSTLYPPTKCPEPILRALIAYALAQTIPTKWRLREARRRLREARVRLSDYQCKPTFGPAKQP